MFLENCNLCASLNAPQATRSIVTSGNAAELPRMKFYKYYKEHNNIK